MRASRAAHIVSRHLLARRRRLPDAFFFLHPTVVVLMALSLSTSSPCVGLRPCSAQRHFVRPLPPPRAGLGDAIKDIGDAFVKIFSKPQTTVEDWANTGTGFQGKIDHHGPGRPFKDGFVNKMPSSGAGQQAAAGGEDAASYMGEALERVVGHNFTGDDTEPPANTGAAGWKGDIHDRKSDGFHSRKV